MREYIRSMASIPKLFLREISISPNSLIIFFATVFIFVIDLNLPLGVAAGIPYALVIFGCLWVSGIYLTYIVSILSFVFVVFGFYLSPGNIVPFEVALINRGLTLLLIVCAAIMVIKIKKTNVDMSALLTNNLIDPVSGFKNMHAFGVDLNTETFRCQRYRRNLSIALIDIDLHQLTQDQEMQYPALDIMQKISNNIRSKIRTSDLFYQIDTQLFVILFPETALSEAKEVCEIIRNKAAFPAINGMNNKFFASIGISTLEENDSSLNLYQRAEAALSLSKQSEKHQVSTLPEITSNKDKNVVPAILSRSRTN